MKERSACIVWPSWTGNVGEWGVKKGLENPSQFTCELTLSLLNLMPLSFSYADGRGDVRQD